MQNDDPVLSQTQLTPLARSGHGWLTHRLVVRVEGLGGIDVAEQPLLILSEVSGLVLLLGNSSRMGRDPLSRC